jgi:hypothetical protein
MPSEKRLGDSPLKPRSPLDLAFQAPAAAQAPAQVPAVFEEPAPQPAPAPAPKKAEKVKEPKEKKDRFGALLPESVIREIKAAVVSLAGPPEALNVSKFVENAARTELKRLRDQYNEGKPFEGNENPRMGRPVKL